MAVLMIIKFWGVIVYMAVTPYTLDQCIESLDVMDFTKAPQEWEVTAICMETDELPEMVELTDEQNTMIDEWLESLDE
tara:strand:+ start:269 stop:502 length:234 start_codon:yes stop_codon:yes gene_type:complete